MRLLLAALALAVPALAWAAPPPGFDKRVDAARQRVGAVGMAAVIVEDGKVTLSKGYGLKQLGRTDRVDADTIFQIGSVSKHFTAAALATLVDDGKLRWDDRVIDHMPDFRMYDPWVTREMTVRDLLVHRSGLGLGQGDLLMVPATSLSRAETVRRIRHLKPATSFRSAYAYDNILYIVAGQLVEEVTGETWEVYVRDRLLRPAGMAASVTNDADRIAAPNRALPHGRMGELRGAGDQEVMDEKAVLLGRNSAPAGAIAASANDMGRWIQVQLAQGRVPGADKPLFSASSHAEMWKGVQTMPISPLPGALAEATPNFQLYALGWNVRDYRGHRIISHGGATQGMRATLVLIPEKKVGFAMMTNSEESAHMVGLQNELLDHYLGLPKRDWIAAYVDFVETRTAAGLKALRAARQERPVSKPSLSAAAYAGTYADPWYGPISVKAQGGALSIDFLQTPGMTAPLEHWAYDTFVARWKDRTTEPAFVTFSLDAAGRPARITMKAVSPLADFSFDYHDLDFQPVAAK